MHRPRTRYGRSPGAAIHPDAFCATKSGPPGSYIRSCHADDQSGARPAFQPCAHAQNALKVSPKVSEVLNTPPLEIKDDEDPLMRLKKERFNAALNEAKARFDLHKRGSTKLPHLIEVSESLL